MNLTKEELMALINVLNMPRQQNLQTAQFCIDLSNKLSKMINAIKPEKVEEVAEKPKA